MVSALSQKIDQKNSFTVHVGKQMLDVVTSGMYSDPRMVLREYIQNAADAIDAAYDRGYYSKSDPLITIDLDGRTRTIVIEDNGTGVSAADIQARLVSLGCSSKTAQKNRGFRGIGRLGGLGYCDLLKFETRSSSKDGVSVIEWDGKALRQKVADIKSHENLEHAVRRIVNLRVREADPKGDPNHFFRVTMVNVHTFHSDVLMNIKGLREYLSQTVPVSYDKQAFPFADEVTLHLSEVPNFKSYNITLNGVSILRPYCLEIAGRDGSSDRIGKIERVELLSPDGVLLCRGWYATTQFKSALPPHVAMRGVRIRQGNIAVGDENFLRDIYSEPRFATWHIGEIHVSPALKLNARRDGFEESPEYENFLEWMSVLCRHLSFLCRHSSTQRSRQMSTDKIVREMRSFFDIPFFLDNDHLERHLNKAYSKIEQLRTSANSGQESRGLDLVESFEAKFLALKEKPVFLHDILDGRTLRNKAGGEVLVEVCKQLFRARSGGDADRIGLIHEIVSPFLKSGSRADSAGDRALRRGAD